MKTDFVHTLYHTDCDLQTRKLRDFIIITSTLLKLKLFGSYKMFWFNKTFLEFDLVQHRISFARSSNFRISITLPSITCLSKVSLMLDLISSNKCFIYGIQGADIKSHDFCHLNIFQLQMLKQFPAGNNKTVVWSTVDRPDI